MQTVEKTEVVINESENREENVYCRSRCHSNGLNKPSLQSPLLITELFPFFHLSIKSMIYRKNR